MKNYFFGWVIVLLAAISTAEGQGLHFSQYYNAPLLLNPANTALMPDADYRAGVNYRTQWASVPAPFKTTSAYVDMQAMRNRNMTNWLGLGMAFWNDKAGNGELSLTRFEALVAYHVMLGEYNMISAGVSAAMAQRTVDFNRLTFDGQWNGFIFDRSLPHGESGYTMRTSFFDLAAGVNYAFFPNEDVYLKIGLGASHITQPTESFYGQENKLGIRPTANVDLLLKLAPALILNPSIYYTNQKSASELVVGSLLKIHAGGTGTSATQIIFGLYHRIAESMIITAGLEYGSIRLMGSYDVTVSSISTVNRGRGAFELALSYQGLYTGFSQGRRTYNCPRF